MEEVIGRSSSIRDDNRWRLAGRVVVVGYGLTCLFEILATGFHVGLNDFWGNVALARQVDLEHPATLYNHFYPLGYATVLWASRADPVVLGCLLSVSAVLVLLWAVNGFGAKLAGAPWALGGTVALATYPQVFRYATTPGPDMIAAALLAVGFVHLYRTDSPGGKAALLGGAALGAAALFRYHAFAFSVATILATAFAQPSVRRHLLMAGGGFLIVYIPQMLVSLLAGHGPFHTGYVFNLFAMVHPINWFDTGTLAIPASAREIFLASPGAFVSAYFQEVRLLWTLPVPAIALAVVARDPALRRFGVVASLTMIVYLSIVAAGGSSRASLPVQFLSVLSWVLLLRATFLALTRLAGRLRPVGHLTRTGLVAGSVVLALSWLATDYGTAKYRYLDNRSYRHVCDMLQTDGVTSSKQVFSSSHSLYCQGLAGNVPWTNGTWLRVYDARYREQFPDLCVVSIECFRSAALTFGVTHVVLTPEVAELSPALSQVYDGPERSFDLRGSDGAFKIFKLR